MTAMKPPAGAKFQYFSKEHNQWWVYIQPLNYLTMAISSPYKSIPIVAYQIYDTETELWNVIDMSTKNPIEGFGIKQKHRGIPVF